MSLLNIHNFEKLTIILKSIVAASRHFKPTRNLHGFLLLLQNHVIQYKVYLL